MTDLNSLEKFNKFYTQEIERRYETSLVDFFQSQVRPRIEIKSPRILDLGAGSKSIFEDIIFEANVTAVDFSSVAIAKAQNESKLDYRLKDISLVNSIEEATYDVIFDSHCLHCITDKEARNNTFQNIYNGLKSGGIFCAEMMVSPANKEVSLPFKYIKSAMDLEKEILQSGFKIKYFMIVRDLKFENANGECDLLRVIGTK